MKEKIENTILSALVCDRYSLGAHWVYNEEELKNLAIDWGELNPPQSLWHRGKQRGDLTHYGDHMLFLIEYIRKNGHFKKEEYYKYWCEKMQAYSGYVDASSRKALENIAASSEDLSICGRISPLLLCSETKEAFLNNVNAFISVTHNSKLALTAGSFFAEILWDSLRNANITALIHKYKPKYPELQVWIDLAIEKKDAPSFQTIREFGPACGIDGGFAGVVYLLLQNKSFKELMIENAKAGGDSSARGMVVAMILGHLDTTELPQEWLE